MINIAPMIGGLALLIAAIVFILILFPLIVVLFRSACDLCSVEPPRFLKSCLVVFIIGLVCAPIAFGIVFGFWLVGGLLHFDPIAMAVLAIFVCILPCALVAGLLYFALLRVDYFKGTAIFTVHSLLGMLVFSVVGLFLLGSVTLVQGIIRWV